MPIYQSSSSGSSPLLLELIAKASQDLAAGAAGGRGLIAKSRLHDISQLDSTQNTNKNRFGGSSRPLPFSAEIVTSPRT